MFHNSQNRVRHSASTIEIEVTRDNQVEGSVVSTIENPAGLL
jgi:hypothetical protein